MGVIAGEPESVSASTKTFVANSKAPDTGVATLHYPNGAIGSITATTSIRTRDIEMSLFVSGTRGVIEVSGPALNHLTLSETIDSELPSSSRASDFDGCKVAAHARFLSALIRRIKDGSGAIVSGQDALRTVRLFNAIHESAAQGVRIALFRSNPDTVPLPSEAERRTMAELTDGLS